MSYSVRLANIVDRHDRDAILPIWSASLHVGDELERKLQWFYRDGPHGPGQAFVLHDAAKAIGCAGLGVRTLWHREHPLRAGLFADLAVDPTHRTVLPALTLVRAIKSVADNELGLGYGFPNRRAIAVYRRAGYQQLGLMSRYARPLRTRRYLERRLGRRLGAVAAAVIDQVLAAAAWLRRHRGRGFELSWLDDVDDRFDQLWIEARLSYPLLCERTAAFLRWRFLRQILDRDYRIAALTDRAGKLRAYAIAHLDGDVAKIVDLFGTGIADLDALVAHLVVALSRGGFESVSMRFLGARAIPRLLAAHGFSRRGETRHVMVSIGAPMRDRPELCDVESWYLTDLDEDT